MIHEIKLTANSCIALSSSINAVSFSSARTTKRFLYDDAGNVIERHEHKGEFKEW
jgi:hypothetical protein